MSQQLNVSFKSKKRLDKIWREFYRLYPPSTVIFAIRLEQLGALQQGVLWRRCSIYATASIWCKYERVVHTSDQPMSTAFGRQSISLQFPFSLGFFTNSHLDSSTTVCIPRFRHSEDLVLVPCTHSSVQFDQLVVYHLKIERICKNRRFVLKEFYPHLILYIIQFVHYEDLN